MQVNLFINYYTDKNSDRQCELDDCFLRNVENPLIDKIIIFATERDFDNAISLLKAEELVKIRFVTYDKRPTFNDYFKLFQSYSSDINIIANSDIIIPKQTITKINNKQFDKNTCLALTRYDIISGYWDSKDWSDATFFDRPDSQDTWIFINCDFKAAGIFGADFTLGIAGCDNRIAYLLDENKFTIYNPSLTLQTFHLHLTGVRNYIDGLNYYSVAPPYKILIPCHIK